MNKLAKVHNLEKKFFSYLKTQFSKNDYVHIDKIIVPKKLSNNINRFYNEKSIWFSRLKINDTKSIYYFGINDGNSKNNNQIIPKFLLKYDTNSISLIRFSKNDVYILIKVLDKSDAFTKIRKYFYLKYANKEKTNDLYYLKLGNLESDDLIKNIKFLLENFKFELNLDNIYLHILDVEDFNKIKVNLNENELIPEGFPYLDMLKLNSYILTLKKIIKNKNLSSDDEKKLNKDLFIKTTSNNYEFNPNLTGFATIDEIFIIIYNIIIYNVPYYEDIISDININFKIKDNETNLIKDDINDKPLINSEENKELIIEKPSEDRKLMDKILNLYREGKSEKEISLLTGIGHYQVEKWYKDGRNNPNKDNIYFREEIDKIRNDSSRIKKTMDDVLKYLRQGKSRDESARLSNIDVDLISTWILEGKKNSNQTSIYFSQEYDKIFKESTTEDLEISKKPKSKRRKKIESFLKAYRETMSIDEACEISLVSSEEFRKWMVNLKNPHDDFIYLNENLNKINAESGDKKGKNLNGSINNEVVVVEEDSASDSVGVVVEENSIDFNHKNINFDVNQMEIFNEFLFLKEDGIFDYNFSNYGISSKGQKIIFDKIINNIKDNIISEDDDPEEILQFYIEEFSINDNFDNMLDCYNNVLNSDFYQNLLIKYNLDNDSIKEVKLLVKNDIESNSLTNEEEIQKRFNIYFTNKFNEVNYLIKLESLNEQDYLQLSSSEFNDVKSQTCIIIKNWHENILLFNDSFEEIWDKNLNKKIDLIKSDARRKFENNFNNKFVIENILEISDLSERKYNNLKKLIYKGIDNLTIKSDIIDENLIKEYYDKI